MPCRVLSCHVLSLSWHCTLTLDMLCLLLLASASGDQLYTVLFSAVLFRIAMAPDAAGRMLALLRWYLSAFFAMRRSSLPKKPYNPVLGEYFQCFWPLASSSGSGSNSNSNANTSRCGFSLPVLLSSKYSTAQRTVCVSLSVHVYLICANMPTRRPRLWPNVDPDEAGVRAMTRATGECKDGSVSTSSSGPVPWCSDEDLAFIAEQVSHHPPSAFSFLFSFFSLLSFPFRSFVSFASRFVLIYI